MKMPGNMNKLMKQAKKLQEQMAKLEEEIKEKTVEATSGGGVVKVVVSGDQELKEIQIDPELLDPEELDMLQDLIMAAVNEGLRKAKEMSAEEMGSSRSLMPNFRDFKMAVFPQPLQQLMEELNKLPGKRQKCENRFHSQALGRGFSLAEALVVPNREEAIVPTASTSQIETLPPLPDPREDNVFAW